MAAHRSSMFSMATLTDFCVACTIAARDVPGADTGSIPAVKPDIGPNGITPAEARVMRNKGRSLSYITYPTADCTLTGAAEATCNGIPACCNTVACAANDDGLGIICIGDFLPGCC